MGYKQDFIKFMVRSGALCFGEFLTKSGRLSPYFINTGNYNKGSQISLLGEYYAACIKENLGDDFDIIYGPAYKGIPLSVAAASALYEKHGIDKGYCFNRKEAKDHGEGGNFIGAKPKDGDRIVIVDDVVTAGTSAKESIAELTGYANVEIKALVVSVDRMEKGKGELSSIQELSRDAGIKICPMVTLDDIVETLYMQEIDGKIVLDEKTMQNISEYRRLYGVSSK